MADEYEDINGHNSDDGPDMGDLPEFDAVAGAPANGAGAPVGGGIPGLGNLLMQPSLGGGMWNPVERAMRGSTKAEEYLPLTNVEPEDIALHMQIMYFRNLYNYGNGRLEECLWSGYQLRRAINGLFMEQVVHMVTGEKMKADEAEKKQMFLNRMRNGTQNQQGNAVGRLYG